MELKDTILAMISTDYKERFKAEYHQLVIRIKKLDNMLNSYKNGTLGFEPTCPIDLLKFQSNAMHEYRVILEQRAFIECIDLKSPLGSGTCEMFVDMTGCKEDINMF